MAKLVILDNKRIVEKRVWMQEAEATARGEVEKEVQSLRREKNASANQLKIYEGRVKELESLLSESKLRDDLLEKEKEGLQEMNKAHGSEISELRSTVNDLKDSLRDPLKLPEEVRDKMLQQGYDLCHESVQAQLDDIRAKDYQAGYDFGLNEAKVPADSELRRQVVIPDVEEEAGESVEGDAAVDT